MAAGHATRVPLALLDDVAKRGWTIHQLHDLVAMWINRWPTKPVPSTTAALEAVLVE